MLIVFAENKRKKELIEMLQKMGYDSDPVKAWKGAQEKVKNNNNNNNKSMKSV